MNISLAERCDYHTPSLIVNDSDRLMFKDITLGDMEQIASYLGYADSHSCDFTIGGIYMWIGYLGYKFAIYRDTLFIRGVVPDDRSRVAFSLPVGQLSVADGVALVRDYCAKNGITAEFSAIPQERLAEFMALAPTSVHELEDWGDYIYSAEALATYRGNKLSKKRNHVNRFFTENPSATTSAINADNIRAVWECYDHICAAAMSLTPMARYERKQVASVLERLYQYPFVHLCLMVEGVVVGFIVGEIIGEVLHVHIEKVNHHYRGAAETLTQLFIQQILAKYPIKWVNRQDDAGDAGLRKSKLSYHPERVLRKYSLQL